LRDSVKISIGLHIEATPLVDRKLENRKAEDEKQDGEKYDLIAAEKGEQKWLGGRGEERVKAWLYDSNFGTPVSTSASCSSTGSMYGHLAESS
jgi:hypothetical protein